MKFKKTEATRTAQTRMATARSLLERQLPYVSSLLQRMPIETVDSEDWNTMGAMGEIAITNRGIVICHAQWVNETEPPKLKTALFHEFLHFLQNHAERCGSRHPQIWNIAGDFCNNVIIDEAKMELPYQGVMPEDYDYERGLSADQYYGRLIEDAEYCRPGDKEGDKGKGGECGGDGEGGGQGQNQGNNGGKKRLKIAICPCGSGAGNAEEWEKQLPDKYKDAGMDEEISDVYRDQVAEDIKQHSKRRGHVPAGMERWAEVRVQRTPKELRRMLQAHLKRQIFSWKSGQTHHTYNRVGRRSSPKVLLPSLRAPSPTVAVVLDTSGSVTDDWLSEFASICAGLVREANVYAFGCDAQATEAVHIRSPHGVKEALKGGGGTDMRVGIEAALELRPKPHFIVVLTDGYTPWPKAPVGVPVTAVLPREGRVPDYSWIKTFHLDI